MTRVYNFGAGPAVLPEEILLTAQEELLNWHDTGMSIVEISNRSKAFMDMMAQAQADCRELLNIPNNYKVLFTVGPARAQFAMVPMNLLRGKTKADYIDTGVWSHMSIAEAKRYCDVNVAASTRDGSYTSLPARDTWQLSDDAAYVYYTSNETINGLEFHEAPNVGDKPLVADMTSNLFSKPLDISQFGLIFAGTQKNIAPAGLTMVIVRDDLIGDALPFTPSVFDYHQQAEKDSLLNTTSSFSVYMAGLMFAWLKKQGGLSALHEINQRKAEKLYAAIDNNDFYFNNVAHDGRSLMNIPFLLANADLVPDFLAKADAAGLKALKGHRYVGGLRASIYNAMPEEGVDQLIAFMQDYAQHHA